MKNGLTKDENDELTRWGVVLYTLYDTATERWSMAVNYVTPQNVRSNKSQPELCYRWLWDQGLKNNKLAQKVLSIINEFSKSK